MTAEDAKQLLQAGKPLSAAEWIALSNFILSLGIAFLVEEKKAASLDRDAIFARADELFAGNEKNLTAHLEEYRAKKQ